MIVLNIAESGLVKKVKLKLVCFRDVTEIILVVRVHIFRIRNALLVPEVVLVWCYERDLDPSLAFFLDEFCDVLRLRHIR